MGLHVPAPGFVAAPASDVAGSDPVAERNTIAIPAARVPHRRVDHGGPPGTHQFRILRRMSPRRPSVDCFVARLLIVKHSDRDARIGPTNMGLTSSLTL